MRVADPPKKHCKNAFAVITLILCQKKTTNNNNNKKKQQPKTKING